MLEYLRTQAKVVLSKCVTFGGHCGTLLRTHCEQISPLAHRTVASAATSICSKHCSSRVNCIGGREESSVPPSY